MTTVCVLSDLHANARALRAAVARVFAGSCDHVVIGGDLLTYGVDVNETLDLVAELQTRHAATLLIGNHDQLYFDLADGRTEYYAKLPDWLRESVDWTASKIDLAQFRARFRWTTEHVMGDVLFAHANPFPFGDWRYLNDEDGHMAAAQALRQRGLRLGVFGHTHRAGVFRARDDRTGQWIARSAEPITLPREGSRFVLNAGSIGQPRETRGMSTMLRLSAGPSSASVLVEDVDYDVTAHVESLETADLSESTRERLCRFFS